MTVIPIISLLRAFPNPCADQDQLRTDFPPRPDYNSTGKAIKVALNAYQTTVDTNKLIYQYDVMIGNGAEKRAVIRKVWESGARLAITGPEIIFDGNKLAWSSTDLPEIRKMIDLDAEDGRQGGREGNSFRLSIRRTKTLDVSIIQQHLEGRIQFGVPVLEAINFLDHVLREGPSVSPDFTKVKRSFFRRDATRSDLGSGIECLRGVYQSLRLGEGKKLIINLDVSNTCFYRPMSLINAICQAKGIPDANALTSRLRLQPDNGSTRKSDFFRLAERHVRKVGAQAIFKGNPFPAKTWVINSLHVNNPRNYRMTWKGLDGKQNPSEITIEAYFNRKYNIRLQHPELPLVEMTKKNVLYPMEFVHILPNQRYPFKLDERQTANMIKFAVTPPPLRLQHINIGKDWLNWGQDKYLLKYGVHVNPQQLVTNARVLPAPTIEFGAGPKKIEKPGTSGRWDLRDKKFFKGNPEPLKSWGIGMFTNGKTKLDKPDVERLAEEFAKVYRKHGGSVANGKPYIMAVKNDAASAVEDLHQATGNHFNSRPQILIFLLQSRDSFHYQRLKKSCDCRFGVVSQCMQINQFAKGQGQYFSNVCMKFNAKLGGATSKAIPDPKSGFKPFQKPTMIIGADVSHASPGSEQASMAAITVSFDTFCGRYAAACQTNGRRVEMITTDNWSKMLGPLTQQWQSVVGGGNLPYQIYYMRDGVSEGQYAQVVNEEVQAIRGVMDRCNRGKPWEGRLTTVICSKRHHVRCFPQKPDADSKGNPLPGTIIEHDVTSPNEWDFYLYSHIALQGTSRPVHYTVIQDSADHKSNVIQNMIYEHCYQYMRSTTSVSLHPAVYYAHLASMRARAHEDIPSAAGPQGGPGFKQNAQPGDASSTGTPVKALRPLFAQHGINFTMWYI